VKKAYRAGSHRDRSGSKGNATSHPSPPEPKVPHPVEEGGQGGLQGNEGHKRQGNAWLAYAFVVFRDESEAKEAKAVFAGKLLAPAWVCRVLPAEEPRGSKNAASLAPGARAGEDPPLGLQLFPPCLRAHERAAAIARHRAAARYFRDFGRGCFLTFPRPMERAPRNLKP